MTFAPSANLLLRVFTRCSMFALGAFACQGGQTTTTAEQTPAPSLAPPQSCPTSFADLAERSDSALAFIETVQAPPEEEGTHGLGSGFVIEPTGLLLTNYHVVRGALAVSVKIKERDYAAKVLGFDAPTDVAVLKIEANGLDSLELGNSAQIRVGDWVIAMGNPFGLSHTVSAGIISAKGRTRHDVDLDPSGYYNFLQTDAGINPGNSGGPLLDLGGRVVGMNTAIRAGANNIGFAIPIDMIRALLPSLVREGKIRRSQLGVVADTLDPERARQLGISTGATLVGQVVAGGPGDEAGLRSGDIITEFDGKPVDGKEMLRWLASIGGVGRKVPLKVRRGPRTLELWVVLTELHGD
jgi:serine protease Do